MKPSVLILDDREGLIASSQGAARMRELGDVRIVSGSLDELSDSELATVQVLMAIRERTRLDATALARMPALELVLQTGGHAYHLDADYTSRLGIPVTLGRRAMGPKAAVPELTFALAVAALRKIPEAQRSMEAGRWEPFLGRTLHGRTLGILGYGRHGQNVARIAKAYGMEVLVWNRSSAASEALEVETAGLEEVLAASDVLSIHLKLSDESRGLLDGAKLGLMKRGSVLINTARGAIIDESALAEALEHGPIGAAGLDVFAEEPLPSDSPLRSLPNVVLTPHIGWTVEEVLLEFASIAAEQLDDYLSGSLNRAELLDPAVTVPEGRQGGLNSSAGR